MKARTYITALLLILPALVTGQEAWTLEDCISFAVENSPTVNNYKARSEIYAQDCKETIASLFPSISASTSAQFSFGRGIDDNTNTYTNVNSFSNSYGVSGSMTLFDGLASVYRVKMAKAANLMGTEEWRKSKDDAAFNTMQQFFLVQGYQGMVDLCREQLEENTRILEQTERMAEAGLKAYPDVAEMKAQVAAAQYELTRNINLHRLSLIKLKEQMNFPLDGELEIVPFDVDRQVAHAGVTPMQVYNFASNHNPVAVSTRLDEDYSLYNYKAVKGSLFPNLYVQGGFNTGYSRYIGSSAERFWNQLENKRGHYVGVGLSIPIFSGLSRSSNTRRAYLNLQIARNTTELRMRELYGAIEQAVADVNGQADEYNQLLLQAEAEEVSYRLSLRKYDEGLISAIELQTSSNRLLESRARANTSVLLYMLQARLLEYYMGVPLYAR
ncbi:MAG: TolC family protein [Rikenellaceae bacterium]|nr:TolC family protein [Rikenellaceae bacterium]